MNTYQKPIVLVLGATGTIGRHIVKELENKQDIHLRIASRNHEKVAELQQQGKDGVYLDMDKPETFALAMAGVDWTVPRLSETSKSERIPTWKNHHTQQKLRHELSNYLSNRKKTTHHSGQPYKPLPLSLAVHPETLRSWHQKHLDKQNPTVVTAQSQAARIAELERENRELKQATEIIRKAAAFFAQAELDRPHK